MKVVLLIGSSSAGKSSLCGELVAEHHWTSMSADEISKKIDIERSQFFKEEILKVLRNKGLISKLQLLMTEDEIYKLCGTGMLTISKGNNKIYEAQFSDPSLAGLESLLKKAGFNESEIPGLSEILRQVSQVEDLQLKKTMDTMYPPQVEITRLYDEAFSKESKSTIVLDVAPGESGNVEKLINDFETRAQEYREQNPHVSLTTSVVLAFCSPQKLSERIAERNRKADEAQNPMEQRVGLDPFYQSASLVTAENKVLSSNENDLSRDELFGIVKQHAPDKTGESVFLENPIDPEALEPLQEIEDEKDQMTISKDGAAKLQLDRDEDQSTLSSADKPRIGSKKTIDEYDKLAKKFRFFENQERATLHVRPELKFDAVIDTGSGQSVDVLAKELVDKLEKTQTSAHRYG